MNREKDYQKLEDDLTQIIDNQIEKRIHTPRKRKNVEAINEAIEERNRRIVEIHNANETNINLAFIFNTYLDIQENGALFIDKAGYTDSVFNKYAGKRSRLQALLDASVNALSDDRLIQTIYRKKRLFEDKYRLAKEVMAMTEDALEVKKKADNADPETPHTEEAAIAYLKELTPLNMELQRIETRFAEIQNDNRISGMLRKLRTTLNGASKSIRAKSRNANTYLFQQAGGIVENYRATSADIANLNTFVSQKQDLERYYAIFDNLGEEERKAQIQSYINAINATIERIQKLIEKQKMEETDTSVTYIREVKEAYDRFREIKKGFVEGEYDTPAKRKKAVEKLKKCRDILKSNGRRVKARDVERFLNATGIDQNAGEETKTDKNEYIFYKKGFWTLAFITLFLFVLCGYLLVS